MAKNRENWGSKIGVILAVAGSAVGLGNFLRFPGQAALNGGGIFMIPYFISLLLIGIPLIWVEWTLGRYGGTHGRNSAPGIFSVVWRRPHSKYFGVLALVIPVVIYMYYVYIESWCLAYAIDYARGAMREVANTAPEGGEMAAYANHFSDLVGAGEMGFPSGRMILILAIVFVFNFYLIFRGISKGIETFCKFAMPFLIICAVIILVRVLTLPNIGEALGFMWNPKVPEGGSIWTELRNADVWLAAAGQIFFSLSIGFGIILNYASYLRRNDDVALSGLTAGSTNEFCEVCLGGLITIPVAFIFLGPALLTPDVIKSTFAVGFNALPAVFSRMPIGNFFGALWFFMLFLAAVTSSLSMLQPAIAFLEEAFDIGRRASVAILGFIVAVGCLIVVYLSKDLIALDTMDFWVGTLLIFVLATIQVIIFGWVFGVDRAREELEKGAEIRIPRIFWFVVKYISPVYLLAIFAVWVWQKLPDKIGEIKKLAPKDGDAVLFVICFILVVMLLFTLLVYLSGRGTNTHQSESG